MGERNKKRRLWHKSPYDGVPGVYAAIQRFLYQIEGPAQLGERDEPAYVPPADPKCPICAQSLKLHRFDRGGPGKPTHMKCPPKPAEQHAQDGQEDLDQSEPEQQSERDKDGFDGAESVDEPGEGH